MGTNYKVETVQVLVDDFNNIATELSDLLEENNISTADLLDFEVVPLGTSFLVVATFKGITPITQSRSFTKLVGLGVSSIKKALTYTRKITPKIGLKVSALTRRITVRQKLNNVSVGLAVTLANYDQIVLAPRKLLFGLTSSLTRGFLESNIVPKTPIGIKPKMFEAIWNGVPIEEE